MRTTLNNFKAFGFILSVFSLFLSVGFASSASAKELVREINLNAQAVAAGYTVKTDDGTFAVGVQRESASVLLYAAIKKLASDELPSVQGEFTRLGGAYEFDVKAQDGSVAVFSKQINLKMKVSGGDIYRKKAIFYWDRFKNEWRMIPSSKEDLNSREVTGFVPFGFAVVAVFEHPTTVEGYGSWYNYVKAVNRKKYAHGVATHIYPKGTKLKITNLKNGKSTQVEVVSYWDKGVNEKRRRALDIVKHAFSEIASPADGVIPVRVEVLSKVAVASSPASGGGSGANKASVASVSKTSRSSVVMDETGNILHEKNANSVYPVASLSKLFTVAVFLETNPDWTKNVTIAPEDDAIGAKLFSPPGDVVTVKDLFYSTLTGSTNNGAKALVRSTGLGMEEFVRRMNAKARAAGLTQTQFFDPTGLDTRNNSTAKEIAQFALKAINRLEILEGTTRSVYSFDEITSIDKMIHHDVHSTNILLAEPHSYTILGSKTGFLNEALHCLMMKVKSKKDGKVYVSVVLGGPTSKARFDETRDLLAKFVP